MNYKFIMIISLTCFSFCFTSKAMQRLLTIAPLVRTSLRYSHTHTKSVILYPPSLKEQLQKLEIEELKELMKNEDRFLQIKKEAQNSGYKHYDVIAQNGRDNRDHQKKEIKRKYDIKMQEKCKEIMYADKPDFTPNKINVPYVQHRIKEIDEMCRKAKQELEKGRKECEKRKRNGTYITLTTGC